MRTLAAIAMLMVLAESSCTQVPPQPGTLEGPPRLRIEGPDEASWNSVWKSFLYLDGRFPSVVWIHCWANKKSCGVYEAFPEHARKIPGRFPIRREALGDVDTVTIKLIAKSERGHVYARTSKKLKITSGVSL